MKAKSKFAIGAGIIVIAISCLAYVGAQQSKTYYHTISEIPTLDGPALHQRLRVERARVDVDQPRRLGEQAFVGADFIESRQRDQVRFCER